MDKSKNILELLKMMERAKTVEDQYNQMYLIQKELNNFTNGEDWESKKTNKHGKVMNWVACIVVECGELLDSIGYKHWKDHKEDVHNTKVEVVDILHFLLSYMQSDSCFVSPRHKAEVFKLFKEGVSRGSFLDNRVEVVLEFIDNVLVWGRTPDINHSKIVGRDFRMLMDMAKIESHTELYELYIKKNVLNLLRQKVGYTNGSYQKEWRYRGGVYEDNKVQEFLDKNEEISLQEYKTVYDYFLALENYYLEMIGFYG